MAGLSRGKTVKGLLSDRSVETVGKCVEIGVEQVAVDGEREARALMPEHRLGGASLTGAQPLPPRPLKGPSVSCPPGGPAMGSVSPSHSPPRRRRVALPTREAGGSARVKKP
jgi:hypothetical protein